MANPVPEKATLFHFLELAKNLFEREGVVMPSAPTSVQLVELPRTATPPAPLP
jgi:hypothetical protein